MILGDQYSDIQRRQAAAAEELTYLRDFKKRNRLPYGFAVSDSSVTILKPTPFRHTDVVSDRSPRQSAFIQGRDDGPPYGQKEFKELLRTGSTQAVQLHRPGSPY